MGHCPSHLARVRDVALEIFSPKQEEATPAWAKEGGNQRVLENPGTSLRVANCSAICQAEHYPDEYLRF